MLAFSLFHLFQNIFDFIYCHRKDFEDGAGLGLEFLGQRKTNKQTTIQIDFTDSWVFWSHTSFVWQRDQHVCHLLKNFHFRELLNIQGSQYVELESLIN